MSDSCISDLGASLAGFLLSHTCRRFCVPYLFCLRIACCRTHQSRDSLSIPSIRLGHVNQPASRILSLLGRSFFTFVSSKSQNLITSSVTSVKKPSERRGLSNALLGSVSTPAGIFRVRSALLLSLAHSYAPRMHRTRRQLGPPPSIGKLGLAVVVYPAFDPEFRR